MQMLKNWLLLALAAGLAGCASVPMGSMEADTKAKAFAPAAA